MDDNRVFCEFFRRDAAKRYPALDVKIFTDPGEALSALDPSVDLLLLDWEMPKIDGAEFLERAVKKGLPRKRVVILSGHTAEELHEKFAMGSCLAVLEKYEVIQKKVLDMILSADEDEG